MASANNSNFTYDADIARGVHFHTAPSGITMQDLVKPEYWSHVSSQFCPGSRVEVVAEDKEFYAEFFIMDCARNWAKMAVLRAVTLRSNAEPIVDKNDFEIKYGNYKTGWRVHRKSDGEIVKQEFQDQASAESWLKDYRIQIGQ